MAPSATMGAMEVYFEPEDPSRDRVVPIKMYLPDEQAGPLPVVLFSHGLGGSREGSAYLGRHWAGAGYAAVFVQHPGSDQSIWEEVPRAQRLEALQAGASAGSFRERTADIPFVIDFLEFLNADPTSPFQESLDLERIAMAGHSFGAVTTQAMMGQQYMRAWRENFEDDRLDCFIPMSPSQSKGIPNSEAFGNIAKPVLCMTGTRDESAIRPEVTPESRLLVYQHLPPGDKYQVIFFDGAHHIFTESRREPRAPRFHPAILEITTHFLNAYLKDDAASLSWLQSEAPRHLLIPEDTWEWK